jgi:hypothetical protein
MRDNIVTDYLVLITSDGKKGGYQIYKDRISENMWPIYRSTPQLLHAVKGRKVIFYIAGKEEFAQHFIASAEIEKIIDNKDLKPDPNQEFRQVLFYVQFKNLKTFLNPMKIKDHINNLSFIDKERRKIYGLYFQGGVCKINQQSYDYIISGSN